MIKRKQTMENGKSMLKRNPEREARYDRVLEEILIEQEEVNSGMRIAKKEKKVKHERI